MPKAFTLLTKTLLEKYRNAKDQNALQPDIKTARNKVNLITNRKNSNNC